MYSSCAGRQHPRFESVAGTTLFMTTKAIKITDDGIKFDNGITLYSNHDSDCCESHYLNFKDLSLIDFEGLKFDLSGDNFFKRVDGYGIELLPITGHPIRIAGHGYNNGYYSTQLDLVLSDGRKFDVSDCQVIES